MYSKLTDDEFHIINSKVYYNKNGKLFDTFCEIVILVTIEYIDCIQHLAVSFEHNGEEKKGFLNKQGIIQ